MSTKSALQAAGYLPAVLKHNTNGWYIEYYSFNPILNKLVRERMRMTKLRSKCSSLVEFKLQANNLINLINNELMAGAVQMGAHLTPVYQMQQLPNFPIAQTAPVAQVGAALPNVPQYNQQKAIEEYQTTSNNIRYYTPIPEVIKLYLADREKALRQTTMVSYRSFCSMFEKWLQVRCPNCKCVLFSKSLAVEYMEYGEMQKEWGAATYNNNLKQARALFSWCVEKCYAKENPFEKIKVKRKEEKKRTLIPEADRKKIREYFEKVNPQYLTLCELVYSSLLRPIEISRVQVKDLHLAEQYILLSGTKTKNHKERVVRLSKELVLRLANHVARAKMDDYLFANGDWTCGPKAMPKHSYDKPWVTMRKKLELPEEYQLYSLRDSGINNMLKSGLDPLTVMQAADHHDLAMTTRYADHKDDNLVARINEKAPTF